MFVGETGGDAASRGAVEEATLDEEGLVDLFERVFFFGERGGEGIEADRASVVLLDDGHEQAAVELVEAVSVHLEHFERVFGGGSVDVARAANLGVVADAAQEAVGDAWCASGANSDFDGAVVVDGDVEDFGGALDDEAKIVVGVEVKAEKDSEAGAERRGEQAGPRGGGDKGEGTDVHDVSARSGALADDDVELVILKGGVEFFFEHGLEAVNFVEEEDLALADVGEDGGEVTLNLQGGAGGLLEAYVELIGDDGGQGGFAEAGRAEEQDVIEGFAAGAGGFKRDGELFLGFRLPDEFVEAVGAELELEGVFVVGAVGGDEPVRILFLRGHLVGVYLGVYRVRGWVGKGECFWRDLLGG